MWLQIGVWIEAGHTCVEAEERSGRKPPWGICKFEWIVLLSIYLLPGKLIVAEKTSCFMS